MKYLKTYENKSTETKLFVDSVRYDLLVIEDENDTIRYKYDENGDYELTGNLSVKEYITEKLLNKKCNFYCESCWLGHTAKIVDVDVFDPSESLDEDNGPWVKVKFTKFGSDEKVKAPDRNIEYEEWHNIDSCSQITVYGEQSKLSKEHDKLREEIIKIKEFHKTTNKYNL